MTKKKSDEPPKSIKLKGKKYNLTSKKSFSSKKRCMAGTTLYEWGGWKFRCKRFDDKYYQYARLEAVK